MYMRYIQAERLHCLHIYTFIHKHIHVHKHIHTSMYIHTWIIHTLSKCIKAYIHKDFTFCSKFFTSFQFFLNFNFYNFYLI